MLSKSNLSNSKKTAQKAVRRQKQLNIVFVRTVLFLFLGFFVLALIIPLRPRYSETEKRELAKFPKFTAESFFSGKYFDGISEWYADTFPFRERFVSLNAALSSVYGKSDVRIHGTVEQGDEIPDVPPASEPEPVSEPETDASSTDSSQSSKTVSDEVSSVASAPESSSQNNTSSAAPAPTTQALDALLINGDTAYEYYNFVRPVADGYIATVNRAAQLLNGKATVYDIIVPTSMGITAPERLTATVNTSDQKKAIDYMYAGMRGVKTVPLYDVLKGHRDEYIYFRTDHHWTALGAYYAYLQLMTVKDAAAVPLTSFIERPFPGYLGSFYTTSKKLPQLAANPDTVYAYQPPSTNAALITDAPGKSFNADIISDMTRSSGKYLTFIKGDHPLTYIKNPTLTDGSVGILIKESFGNAFAPFLVEHYEHLYIVDYRYIAKVDNRGLVQFCNEKGGTTTDVIFMNNISATRNRSIMGNLSDFVK